MSKLEANISLLIITFLSAIHYVFLTAVPESVSHFAFLSITNLVGFLIALAFFFGELFRLDKHQVIQSIYLAAELVAFNLFMLKGGQGTNPSVTSAVVSSYFVFVVIFTAVFQKIIPDKGTVSGVIIVLAGLFLMTDADIDGLINANIFYLLVADAAFAFYVMTVGAYAEASNPSILAMGQMFFCFLFSLILWAGDAVFFGASFSLPSNPQFWGSVIYLGFFIRGLFGIVQIYAQRYVSPLNTSLIFSTEIVMTMAVSPLLAPISGMPPEKITVLKIAGSVLIVAGLLITDPVIFRSAGNIFRLKRIRVFFMRLFRAGLDFKIIFISALVYAVIDLPVQLMHVLPVNTGIKNFLPVTLGLFFGPSGVLGCCAGCLLSFVLQGLTVSDIIAECINITVVGIGMWYGWHFLSNSDDINFRNTRDYVRYVSLLFVLSALCLNVKISASYFITGLLISLPLNILFGSLLGIDPVLPDGKQIRNDADFIIDADPATLEKANEILEEAGSRKGAKMKQIMEVQSCIEELSIRIIKNIPEAKINVSVRYGYAVSVKVSCAGKKYNPFRLEAGETVLDIMSLRIIKHRALRASYSHSKGENFIHVVI